MIEEKEILLAPNGKPSNLTPEQYRIVRTPEFKAWFGDWERLANVIIKDPAIDEITLGNISKDVSKVVDENGEPLVVYHGTTNKNINIFRPLSYFTENYSYAKVYGLGLQYSDEMDDEEYDEIINRGEENVYSVFLNIVNPLKADRDFFTDNFEGSTKVKIAKIDGYDGMINTIPKTYIPFYKENENQFLIFNSNQIKLADGSNTTFDGSNPDIRFAKGGEIPTVESISEQDKKYINSLLEYVYYNNPEEDDEVAPNDAPDWIIEGSYKFLKDNGVNKIYRGVGKGSYEHEDAYSWTYNKDVAKNFGKRIIDIALPLDVISVEFVFDWVKKNKYTPEGATESFIEYINDFQGGEEEVIIAKQKELSK